MAGRVLGFYLFFCMCVSAIGRKANETKDTFSSQKSFSWTQSLDTLHTR